jgi:type IV pilus assembly protein PilV
MFIPKINFRLTTGFTLIEVLVSMVILALGLLGIASLQAIALKNNQDAYLYAQANALAYEMGDRIKANKLGWAKIPTPLTSCATGCNSATASCAPAQMAAYDYCYWKQKATTLLLTGATVNIKPSPDVNTAPCTGGAPSLCLIITWPRIDSKYLTGIANYQLEVTP